MSYCLIHFEDDAQESEVFDNLVAAATRYTALKDNWNCTLFVEEAALAASQAEVTRLREVLEACAEQYDCCLCDDDPCPIIDNRARCLHCKIYAALVEGKSNDTKS